jgi:hypothetical protein
LSIIAFLRRLSLEGGQRRRTSQYLPEGVGEGHVQNKKATKLIYFILDGVVGCLTKEDEQRQTDVASGNEPSPALQFISHLPSNQHGDYLRQEEEA